MDLSESAPEDEKKTNDCKVFVGNLHFQTSKDDLNRLFAPFGTVIGVNLRTDRNTGKPRGFGFVTYEKSSQAEAAIIGLHNTELLGRKLTVNAADARGGGGEKQIPKAKPAWVTVPTPRRDVLIPSPVIDSTVKDYSGVSSVNKNSTGKVKPSGGGGKRADGSTKSESGASSGTGLPKPNLWTSWTGPA